MRWMICSSGIGQSQLRTTFAREVDVLAARESSPVAVAHVDLLVGLRQANVRALGEAPRDPEDSALTRGELHIVCRDIRRRLVGDSFPCRDFEVVLECREGIEILVSRNRFEGERQVAGVLDVEEEPEGSVFTPVDRVHAGTPAGRRDDHPVRVVDAGSADGHHRRLERADRVEEDDGGCGENRERRKPDHEHRAPGEAPGPCGLGHARI